MRMYSFSNMTGAASNLKWNIIATTTKPTNETPGQIGDIIIITDQDISKLKTVVTKDMADTNLANNAINVYEDFNQQAILVNVLNGFKMYLFANGQNIILDGEEFRTNVYFYDGRTNSWIECLSSYRDILDLNKFIGKTLDVDTYWGFPELSESVDTILPPVIKEELSDTFDVISFSGCTSIDVDNLMPSVFDTLSESLAVSINGSPVI